MSNKSEATNLIGRLMGILALFGFLVILFVPGLDFGAALGVSYKNGEYVSYGGLAAWWFVGPLCAVLCLIAFGILRGLPTGSADLKANPRRLILKRFGSVVIDAMTVVSLLAPVLAYIVASIELGDFSLHPKEFVRTTPSPVDIVSVISLIGSFLLLGFVFFRRGERGARTPGVVVMGIYKDFPTAARDVVDPKRGFLFILTYVLAMFFIPYYLIKEKTIFIYDGNGVYRESRSPTTDDAAE